MRHCSSCSSRSNATCLRRTEMQSELLAQCVATADLFYSPSCCETLGQVFLEAMASGTPVVGAGICGVLEAFSHVSCLWQCGDLRRPP